MRIQDVLRRPMITEKSTELRTAVNIVAFAVDRRANKIEIKRRTNSRLKTCALCASQTSNARFTTNLPNADI